MNKFFRNGPDVEQLQAQQKASSVKNNKATKDTEKGQIPGEKLGVDSDKREEGVFTSDGQPIQKLSDDNEGKADVRGTVSKKVAAPNSNVPTTIIKTSLQLSIWMKLNQLSMPKDQ
jgi:hypothetical protein